MAIIITSPAAGSLKINNSSASPQSQYLCNLVSTVVVGDPINQSVAIQNAEGGVMFSVQVKRLTTVAASSPAFWTIGNAVDAISSLIIH